MSQPNNNNDNNGDDHKYKKIFVGGLAWSVTTYVLRSTFQERCGEVLDANVVSQTLPDGNIKSKGYGFVTFRDAESANRACQHPPEIDGRQTNVNLAYFNRKNNHNHSNQTGILQQAGPSHQYQHGSFNQMAWHPYENAPFNKMTWHQYPNGWFNQVAWHPCHTNAHFPHVYWDSYSGAYRPMHDVPHYHCPSNNMHWHQTNSVRPPGMPQPPTEPRIEEMLSTAADGESSDKNEDVDPETDSGVDQQNGKDQEGEINGQENGIEQDVNIQGGEKILIETGREEKSENTPQENGLDHEEKTQHIEAGLITQKEIDENA